MLSKGDALRILYTCADSYNAYYKSHNYIYLYLMPNKQVRAIEVTYNSSHFLHLTGVKFKPGKGISANSFYNMCLKRRLSPSSFEIASNGTTEMKLRCLEAIFAEHLKTNMAGQYNRCKPLLNTDILIGGANSCLGFVSNGINHFMVPNTLLKDDIRKLVNKSYRVLAVLKKPIDAVEYNEVVYCSKNIECAKDLFLNYHVSSTLGIGCIIDT